MVSGLQGDGKLVHALKVLILLTRHKYMTGSEIAAKIGVTDRNARKLIDEIRKAGIPITVQRGRMGGYGLDTKQIPELLSVAEYVHKKSEEYTEKESEQTYSIAEATEILRGAGTFRQNTASIEQTRVWIQHYQKHHDPLHGIPAEKIGRNWVIQERDLQDFISLRKEALREKECPYCGEIFKPVKVHQNTCGKQECVLRPHGIHIGMKTVICKNCGTSFQALRTSKETCSKKCQYELYKKRKRKKV